ncbi:MAG: hypothetical protein M0Q13_02335 [Methanothrix sp.]|jgi:hypothetical protein|nr:hypothetical protein [Methanothrix sp.]
MAAAIRIKLGDLLSILMEKPPVVHDSHTRQVRLFSTASAKAERRPLNRAIEEDLEAIKAFLLNGTARRDDLEMELNMSDHAVLHRLDLLKERGVLIDLPGDKYGILGGRQ